MGVSMIFKNLVISLPSVAMVGRVDQKMVESAACLLSLFDFTRIIS